MDKIMDTSTEESVNYDDFFGSFEGEDGNQTDTAEDTAETEVEETNDTAEKPVDEPDGGETNEEVTEEEAEEVAAEGESGADNGKNEQAFVPFSIKVNKEDREVATLAEAQELAQKGADYDRVKGQLETSRQNEQALQETISEQKPYMEMLNLLSESTGKPLTELLETLHVNLLKSQGYTDKEAAAEIRALKAEKQLKSVNDQQQKAQTEEQEAQSRREREIAEFAQRYPGVNLTEEDVKQMRADVQAGMSMSNAYQKMLLDRREAEIAEKEQKAKDDAQNKRNRAKSPGGQKDSGGQRKKDEFDDFFSAFEK